LRVEGSKSGKAGTMMTKTKSIYYILSGEGIKGTWSRVETTRLGLKQRLTREKCGGDRWAKAWVYGGKEIDDAGEWTGWHIMYGIEGTEFTAVPDDVVKSLQKG
jgi:hypothetical protein